MPPASSALSWYVLRVQRKAARKQQGPCKHRPRKGSLARPSATAGATCCLQDLDQFQAHLILKRWAKESGAEASWEGLPPDHQVSLDPNSLAQVRDPVRCDLGGTARYRTTSC